MKIRNFVNLQMLIMAVFSVTVPAGAKSEMSRDNIKTENLYMVTGEQKVIDATGVSSFSESTRGIIEVKIPGGARKMVLTAIRPGSTSLLLISHNGKQKTVYITVFSRSPEIIKDEIKQLLGSLTGLSVKKVGSKLFLDGYATSEKDMNRVAMVVAEYEGQIISLVSLNPKVVRPRTNIRLDLTFVELRKRNALNAGINWPGAIGPTQTISGSLDFAAGTIEASYNVIDQALPYLDFAEKRGWARIRKQATMITTDENNASYSSGGEVNVAIAGSQSAELRTIPYGCELKVTPHLDKKTGKLDLEVEAEVSELTETTQSVPGRTISKIKTLVHLGLGQSIMLSGLDSQSETKSKSGLPFLSRIPILGFFFGTASNSFEQVDSKIIITPTVVENLDQEGKMTLEKALAKFESFKGKFEKKNSK